MEPKPASHGLSISGLHRNDVPDGWLFPEFPSSFEKNATSYNDRRYIIHDISAHLPNWYNYIWPLTLCPAMGNELPLLLRRIPSAPLQEHWRKWIPHFQEPDYRVFSEDGAEHAPLITAFPHQNLPPEKHALNPDLHYRLLSKATIPEAGAPCPKHLSLEDYTLPCMIKATHGLSGQGTYMARNQNEADAALRELRQNLGRVTPVVTEVILEVTGDYCVEFYLQKNGEMHWVGVSRQIIGDEFSWGGGIVDINEQEKLKELFIDTMQTIKEFLHTNGYFGWVGVDVLTNKHGQFANDFNLRINGATPVLLLSPVMAQRGLPVGVMEDLCKFPCDVKNVVSTVDDINAKGEVIVIILSLDSNEEGCEGYISVFAKSEMEAKQARKQFLSLYQ